MFKKQLFISALVVTFCFGLVGTAMADPVAFDESQIAKTVQAQMEQAQMTANEAAPMAGDHVKGENNEQARLVCASDSGHISNLDHTTAKLDAKNCS